MGHKQAAASACSAIASTVAMLFVVVMIHTPIPPFDPAQLAQAMLGWTMPAECVAGVRENLLLLAEHAARVGGGGPA